MIGQNFAIAQASEETDRGIGILGHAGDVIQPQHAADMPLPHLRTPS